MVHLNLIHVCIYVKPFQCLEFETPIMRVVYTKFTIDARFKAFGTPNQIRTRRALKTKIEKLFQLRLETSMPMSKQSYCLK